MPLRLPLSNLIALIGLTFLTAAAWLAWEAQRSHHALAAVIALAPDHAKPTRANQPPPFETGLTSHHRLTALSLIALSAALLCLATLRIATGRLLRPLDQLQLRLTRIAAGDFTTRSPSRPGSAAVAAMHAALDHLSAEGASRQRMQAELARLGDRVVEANRQMMHDLQAAAGVQRAQLPAAPRDVAGATFHAFFRPSRVIAGDTYDCLNLPDGRSRIFQIDVSGHGAAAALVSLASHIALKQALLAHPDEDLAALIARINRDWAADLPYFTLLALELDPARRCATVVQCGHPPLLHLSATGSITPIGKGGLPLGVLPDAQFDALILPFHPGDRLILATDGVTEAADPQGRFFGDDRFRALLARHRAAPVPALFDQIERALWDWCGTETLDDDITILVLEAT